MTGAQDKNGTTAGNSVAEEDRTKPLWNLFDKLLAALLIECAKPDARASMLDVARRFLRDNQVSLSTRPNLAAGLTALAKRRGKLPFN